VTIEQKNALWEAIKPSRRDEDPTKKAEGRGKGAEQTRGS